MKKTYTKPVTIKKAQNKIHCGVGNYKRHGDCGKLDEYDFNFKNAPAN